tara:strand:+ start:465 stop:977 length:513 start_codon:yes stop_codon:yes gene_type:complete
MNNVEYVFKQKPKWKSELESDLSQYVSININPVMQYDLDIMKQGVIKDIDRDYTYDVVPKELEGGILFQPIHRIPKGTSIELNVHNPVKIYFIFHNGCDGNYTNIFKKLEGWELCNTAPQYDINCTWDPEHGLYMTMYKLIAKPGTYVIPPGENGVAADWACWNLVFMDI